MRWLGLAVVALLVLAPATFAWASPRSSGDSHGSAVEAQDHAHHGHHHTTPKDSTAKPITVEVNGKSVTCTVTPFSRRHTEFVEVEAVCRAVGAEAGVDTARKLVTIRYKGKTSTLDIGDRSRDVYMRKDVATAGFKALAKAFGGSAAYDKTAASITFTVS